MERKLSASILFSSMTVFDMLRDQLHIVFYFGSQSITGKVSLDRVDDFLKNVSMCVSGLLLVLTRPMIE